MILSVDLAFEHVLSRTIFAHRMSLAPFACWPHPHVLFRDSLFPKDTFAFEHVLSRTIFVPGGFHVLEPGAGVYINME